MNIFVGNLAKDVSDKDLQTAFAEFGNVKSAKVIKDLDTGESKGFGFVEMPGNAEALKAMMALNSKDIKGKRVTLSEARPKTNDKRSGGSRADRSGGHSNA